MFIEETSVTRARFAKHLLVDEHDLSLVLVLLSLQSPEDSSLENVRFLTSNTDTCNHILTMLYKSLRKRSDNVPCFP